LRVPRGDAAEQGAEFGGHGRSLLLKLQRNTIGFSDVFSFGEIVVAVSKSDEKEY